MYFQSRSDPGDRVHQITLKNRALARGKTTSAAHAANAGHSAIDTQSGKEVRLSTASAVGTTR